MPRLTDQRGSQGSATNFSFYSPATMAPPAASLIVRGWLQTWMDRHWVLVSSAAALVLGGTLFLRSREPTAGPPGIPNAA
jgi:hypothetical protein